MALQKGSHAELVLPPQRQRQRGPQPPQPVPVSIATPPPPPPPTQTHNFTPTFAVQSADAATSSAAASTRLQDQLVMGPDPRQDVTIPAAQMATGSDTTQTEPNAMPHLPQLSKCARGGKDIFQAACSRQPPAPQARLDQNFRGWASRLAPTAPPATHSTTPARGCPTRLQCNQRGNSGHQQHPDEIRGPVPSNIALALQPRSSGCDGRNCCHRGK